LSGEEEATATFPASSEVEPSDVGSSVLAPSLPLAAQPSTILNETDDELFDARVAATLPSEGCDFTIDQPGAVTKCFVASAAPSVVEPSDDVSSVDALVAVESESMDTPKYAESIVIAAAEVHDEKIIKDAEQQLSEAELGKIHDLIVLMGSKFDRMLATFASDVVSSQSQL
jgi:hypothetical protein